MDYKQATAGHHQLSFYLATGVRQWVALSFPKHYVFGAAQIRAGVIRTYAVTWSGSKVTSSQKIISKNLRIYAGSISPV
jgi:hypothetical protein